jgi:hypothetical protein
VIFVVNEINYVSAKLAIGKPDDLIQETFGREEKYYGAATRLDRSDAK